MIVFGALKKTAYDADALAFIASAGITDSTQKSAINNLVTGLKTAGIWSKFMAIYPIVGGTDVAHSRNLKNPADTDAAYRMVFVGSPTHSSNGVLFNGSSQYANTNIAGTNLPSLNSHISFYPRETKAVFSVDDMGGYEGNGSRCLIGIANNVMDLRLQAGGPTSIPNPSGLSTGLFVASRTTGVVSGYIRGNLISDVTTTGSVLQTGAKIILGGRMQGSTGTPDNYMNRTYSFASLGQYLTASEVATFNSIVQTFQTALGRAIP
jgi:hypothetical protein